MGRIEDLGLVVDKGLEWKQRAVDAEAERDHLRAEVERLRGENTALDDKLWINFELRMECLKERDAVLAQSKAVIEKYGDGEEDQSLMQVADALYSNGSEAWHQALKEQDKAFNATARAEAALTTAAGLRRALEEVRCRCSRGIDNHCPECGDDLDRVVNNGPLNDDQFDAVKAGDWYCKKCKSDAAATGFKYWLDRQLPVVVYQTCDRCTALAASPAEHERRIKAEALREAAGKISAWQVDRNYHLKREATGSETLAELRAEADRLEAANGR